MSTIEVLKRKCGNFFGKEEREVIKAVVKDIHHIISEATHLLKERSFIYLRRTLVPENKVYCLL